VVVVVVVVVGRWERERVRAVDVVVQGQGEGEGEGDGGVHCAVLCCAGGDDGRRGEAQPHGYSAKRVAAPGHATPRGVGPDDGTSARAREGEDGNDVVEEADTHTAPVS
jgi:hypothetical protein